MGAKKIYWFPNGVFHVWNGVVSYDINRIRVQYSHIHSFTIIPQLGILGRLELGEVEATNKA